MAISNSTTLTDLVAQIVSADVQSAAYANRVTRGLVRASAVPPGAGSVHIPQFPLLSAASLTEGVAPASTTMTSAGVTLTPVERGTYVQLSKRLLHADPFQDLSPYGDQLGRTLAADEDSLVITALQGTTSTAINPTGNALTVAYFLAAIAALEAANAPQPYYAIFHPNSWAKMRNALGDAASFWTVGQRTVEGFGVGAPNNNSYVGQPFGIPCFISTAVGGDSATPTRRDNVVFSQQAVATAYMQDIGVDVFDNVTARALDLMAWYSFAVQLLKPAYVVNLGDTLT